MTEKSINLRQISDMQLRDDGKEAKLTLTGADDESVCIRLSLDQLQELGDLILKSAFAARFNPHLHSDTPNAFTPLREVYLVKNLSLEIAPTGHLNFLIVSRDNKSAQITLFPNHSRYLRQILGGTGQEFQMG